MRGGIDAKLCGAPQPGDNNNVSPLRPPAVCNSEERQEEAARAS